jgi:histidinol-phosphate phosphatase family protein
LPLSGSIDKKNLKEVCLWLFLDVLRQSNYIQVSPEVNRGWERAVFIDRDGTIAKDVPYCCRVEDFEILPTVPQGIRLLNEQGFKVVVITNQSGIARGYFTEETLSLIHQKMKDELDKYGAWVDAIYVCPHHPDEGCECRKPKPTLLLQAAKQVGIALELSYMVGDDARDVEAGRTAGCKTILVTTGPSQGNSKRQGKPPDYVANSLHEAAEWIIKDVKSRTAGAKEGKQGVEPYDY